MYVPVDRSSGMDRIPNGYCASYDTSEFCPFWRAGTAATVWMQRKTFVLTFWVRIKTFFETFWLRRKTFFQTFVQKFWMRRQSKTFVQTCWVRTKTFIQKTLDAQQGFCSKIWMGSTTFVQTCWVQSKARLFSKISDAKYCEARLLFKHFRCEAKLLFKNSRCEARL